MWAVVWRKEIILKLHIHKAYIKKQKQSDWVPEDSLVFIKVIIENLICLYLVCGHYWISLLDIKIFISISTQNYS